MATIGYARVSRREQHLDLQVSKLKEMGCTKIFTEKQSGAKEDRKILAEALAYLREGDTFVVWKLDRAGRSLRHLIDIVVDLNARGIGFKSVTENIDTTTSSGKLLFHIMGALAEFERDLIRERTNAGLDEARAQGKKLGRKKANVSQKIRHIQKAHADGVAVKDTCALLHISKTGYYRYLRQA